MNQHWHSVRRVRQPAMGETEVPRRRRGPLSSVGWQRNAHIFDRSPAMCVCLAWKGFLALTPLWLSSSWAHWRPLYPLCTTVCLSVPWEEEDGFQAEGECVRAPFFSSATMGASCWEDSGPWVTATWMRACCTLAGSLVGITQVRNKTWMCQVTRSCVSSWLQRNLVYPD